MSQNKDVIQAVRLNIANSIHNDCLPTRLTTGALKEICFQYDKYMNAKTEKDQHDILKCIKNDIELINRQSIFTGQGKSILVIDDNDDDIKNIGETISIIYALPYRTNMEVDYVGYAYGNVCMQQENGIAYNLYHPNEYIDACSATILYSDDSNDANHVWGLLMESLRAYESYDMIIRGETRDSDVGTPLTVMQTKIQQVSDYIIDLGGDVKSPVSESFAQTIAQYIHTNCKYAQVSEIEKIRMVEHVTQQTQSGIGL